IRAVRAVDDQSAERHHGQFVVEHTGRADGDSAASVRHRRGGVREGARAATAGDRHGLEESRGRGGGRRRAVDVRSSTRMEAMSSSSPPRTRRATMPPKRPTRKTTKVKRPTKGAAKKLDLYAKHKNEYV